MNLFDENIGHLHIQEQLLNSYCSDRLPHAFLFHGPEGCGKEAFAIAISQLLNTGDADGNIDRTSAQYLKISLLQHPDLQFIFPTPAKTNLKPEELQAALKEKAQNPYRRVTFSGKNTFIGIDTIRELKKEASFRLYEGRKKMFIIAEADQMRVEAANALLKLLEEPPQNLMLILTTSNIHKILPTIKSRCQMIRFRPLPETDIKTIANRYATNVDPHALPTIIRLSGYNIKRTFDFLEQDVLNLRDQAIEFLRKVVMIHKSHELMQIIEPLAAKKDQQQSRLLLWFLLLWFQDMLHLKYTSIAEDKLHNFDKAETLKKFMLFTPNADIVNIVWEIESALRSLDDVRNFNPLLILATLAIKLNKKLKNS